MANCHNLFQDYNIRITVSDIKLSDNAEWFPENNYPFSSQLSRERDLRA